MLVVYNVPCRGFTRRDDQRFNRLVLLQYFGGLVVNIEQVSASFIIITIESEVSHIIYAKN